MFAIRALTVLLATVVVAASATGQSRCKGRRTPGVTSADAIFLALIHAVEVDTESIGFPEGPVSKWPMIQFVVTPRFGWKLDPRSATEMWDPDTTGLFIFSIEPDQAPALRPGDWALVYMKVPVDMVITKPAYAINTDTGYERLNGFLDVLPCGVRATPDTSLGTRLYGPPTWRTDTR